MKKRSTENIPIGGGKQKPRIVTAKPRRFVSVAHGRSQAVPVPPVQPPAALAEPVWETITDADVEAAVAEEEQRKPQQQGKRRRMGAGTEG